jgi:predicted nicotinamide N-methyase
MGSEAPSAANDDDPADVLLQRGARLRQLRQLEAEDEAARRQTTPVDRLPEPPDKLSLSTIAPHNDDEDDVMILPDGARLLLYESFLRHQRYYDDLKHVDYRYIDFGSTRHDDDDDMALLIEQDKRLGKGGLCWDAAVCLADHVIAMAGEGGGWPPVSPPPTRVIELGCGTGLCGMLVAKAVAGLEVTLTDLPALLPLLSRNVHRNFAHILVHPPGATSTKDDDDEAVMRSEAQRTSRSPVAAQVLDWADVAAAHPPTEPGTTTTTTYDVILGADVVASLYDPQALAATIHALCHTDTLVVLTFKERLSSVHRRFEEALDQLFDEWTIRLPTAACRNHNPDIRVLQARRPKLSDK